jgi:hypothetical protein
MTEVFVVDDAEATTWAEFRLFLYVYTLNSISCSSSFISSLQQPQ